MLTFTLDSSTPLGFFSMNPTTYLVTNTGTFDSTITYSFSITVTDPYHSLTSAASIINFVVKVDYSNMANTAAITTNKIFNFYWWSIPTKILTATLSGTPAAASVQYYLDTPYNTVTFFDAAHFLTTGVLNWASGFPHKERHCEGFTDLKIRVVADGYTYLSNTFQIIFNEILPTEYQFFVPPDQKDLVCLKNAATPKIVIDFDSYRVINTANTGDNLAWTVIAPSPATYISFVGNVMTIDCSSLAVGTILADIKYVLTRKTPVFTFTNNLKFNFYVDTIPAHILTNYAHVETVDPINTKVIFFDVLPKITDLNAGNAAWFNFYLVNQPRNPDMTLTYTTSPLALTVRWEISLKTPSSKTVILRVIKFFSFCVISKLDFFS